MYKVTVQKSKLDKNGVSHWETTDEFTSTNEEVIAGALRALARKLDPSVGETFKLFPS